MKNIFTSKEQFILRYILSQKISEYKKHRENVLTSDFVKYEIDQTIKDIEKIIKKIKNNSFKEKSISYNEMIKELFK